MEVVLGGMITLASLGAGFCTLLNPRARVLLLVFTKGEAVYEDRASPRIKKPECHRSNSQVSLGAEVWPLSPQRLAGKRRGKKPGKKNKSKKATKG